MPVDKRKSKIRLSDFANLVMNKRTNQYSLNLKKKKLVKFGINPKMILDMEVRKISW